MHCVIPAVVGGEEGKRETLSDAGMTKGKEVRGEEDLNFPPPDPDHVATT